MCSSSISPDSTSLSSRSRLSSHSSLALSSLEDNVQSQYPIKANTLESSKFDSSFSPVTPSSSSISPASTTKNDKFFHETPEEVLPSTNHSTNNLSNNLITSNDTGTEVKSDESLSYGVVEENDCDVFDQYMKEIYATGISEGYENDEDNGPKSPSKSVNSLDKDYTFARNIFSPSLKSIWNALEEPKDSSVVPEKTENEVPKTDVADNEAILDASLGSAKENFIAYVNDEPNDKKPMLERNEKEKTDEQDHAKDSLKKNLSENNFPKFASIGTNTDPEMFHTKNEKAPIHLNLKIKEKDKPKDTPKDKDVNLSTSEVHNRANLRNGLRRFCGTFSPHKPSDAINTRNG